MKTNKIYQKILNGQDKDGVKLNAAECKNFSDWVFDLYKSKERLILEKRSKQLAEIPAEEYKHASEDDEIAVEIPDELVNSAPTHFETPDDYHRFYADSARCALVNKIIELSGQCEYQNESIELRDKKIINLHKIINKQGERVKRQAARITELEALYAGTKRSKKAAKIKAKYKALRRYADWLR